MIQSQAHCLSHTARWTLFTFINIFYTEFLRIPLNQTAQLRAHLSWVTKFKRFSIDRYWHWAVLLVLRRCLTFSTTIGFQIRFIDHHHPNNTTLSIRLPTGKLSIALWFHWTSHHLLLLHLIHIASPLDMYKHPPAIQIQYQPSNQITIAATWDA